MINDAQYTISNFKQTNLLTREHMLALLLELEDLLKETSISFEISPATGELTVYVFDRTYQSKFHSIVYNFCRFKYHAVMSPIEVD